MKSDKKIGIIGVNLAPYFNEAFANEMHLLSRELNIPVLTCNDLGLVPFKKLEQYFIVNSKFLTGTNPLLYLLNGALFYFFIKLFERKFDVILSSAGGVNSRLLKYLNHKKCNLILNTIPYSINNKEAKTFAKKIAPKLHGVIAQSQRVRNRLREMGIDSKKICLIYPWVDLNKFKYSEPPDSEEFRILFASAPIFEDQSGKDFWEKGLPLLLEAFKEFTKHTNAILWLLWRGYCDEALNAKIKELNLEDQVNVINEIADMPHLYAQSHITVIPFLNTRRSPEIPLSAVESLACGRPVVATDVVELIEIIQTYTCGYIAKPTKDDFLSALKECKENYAEYQRNCRQVAEELFSFDIGRFMDLLKERI